MTQTHTRAHTHSHKYTHARHTTHTHTHTHTSAHKTHTAKSNSHKRTRTPNAHRHNKTCTLREEKNNQPTYQPAIKQTNWQANKKQTNRQTRKQNNANRHKTTQRYPTTQNPTIAKQKDDQPDRNANTLTSRSATTYDRTCVYDAQPDPEQTWQQPHLTRCQQRQKLNISLLSAPVDEHFHFHKTDCLSTLKFNTTPAKAATCT